MGNLFKVVHGCWTRYSAAIDTTLQTTSYKKGRVLTLDAAGKIITHTGSKSTYPTAGLALDPYTTPLATGPYDTLSVGNPTATNTVILDSGVVVNDELQSGVSFAGSALLYVSTTGFVTTSGNGTGAGPTPIIGSNIGTTAVAGDPARPLTMFFQCTY